MYKHAVSIDFKNKTINHRFALSHPNDYALLSAFIMQTTYTVSLTLLNATKVKIWFICN